MTSINLTPIGQVHTDVVDLPQHCRYSDVEGTITIKPQYHSGLTDISVGEEIIVLFYFHQSPAFTPDMLRLVPPHRNEDLGVFSTCSPRRPNPIGLSVVEVIGIEHNAIKVKGIDMRDGTPVVDIKPFRAFKEK